MKKLWFLLMQLFPLMYVSEYRTNDHCEVAVWRQWFGRRSGFSHGLASLDKGCSVAVRARW